MGDEASNMQKILLCALLVAAAVAHDFKPVAPATNSVLLP